MPCGTRPASGAARWDLSKRDQAHFAGGGVKQERRSGGSAKERTGVEDSCLADDVVFGGEGVAAEQVVVLLFLEKLVEQFFVIAVGDDDAFFVGLDFAHDAHAFEAEVVAVAHEAGAVEVAVAPDEDAADAGDNVQNVAATDIATVNDGFNGGSGKNFDGGGDRVCPSVGITTNTQHPYFSK